MELNEHEIQSGRIEVVQVVNPCFYWVRCSVCSSLTDVNRLIESCKPANVDGIALNDKVVIKHYVLASNCVRWDRAVVHRFDADEGLVGVYLPDTMDCLTLSLSSVFKIELSKWQSVQTTHIVGLHSGVPLSYNYRFDEDPDAGLMSILKPDDLKAIEFSLVEVRKYRSKSIAFGHALVTSEYTANLLDSLVHRRLVKQEENYFDVLHEEGWLDTLIGKIREVNDIVNLRRVKSPNKVNVIPPPPVIVDRTRMEELRNIRVCPDHKIEDLILPNLRSETHEEYNQRKKLSAVAIETGSKCPDSKSAPSSSSDGFPRLKKGSRGIILAECKAARLLSGRGLLMRSWSDASTVGSPTSGHTFGKDGKTEAQSQQFAAGQFDDASPFEKPASCMPIGQQTGRFRRPKSIPKVHVDDRPEPICSGRGKLPDPTKNTGNVLHSGGLGTNVACQGVKGSFSQLDDKSAEGASTAGCSLREGGGSWSIKSAAPRSEVAELPRKPERHGCGRGKILGNTENPGNGQLANKVGSDTEETSCQLDYVLAKGGYAGPDQAAPSTTETPELSDVEPSFPVGNSPHAASTSSTSLSSTEHQLNPLIMSADGINVAKLSLRAQKGLILGEGAPDIRVYDHLGDFDLNEEIRNTARRAGLMNLTRPQSLVMPAILARRNVIVIGPNRTKKTSAVILPLINLLLDAPFYSGLKPGYGPRCVIVAPFAERVKSIGQLCSQYGGRMLTTITTHGGGLEEERYNSLIAGCDILVTTPLSWLRLLSFGYVTNHHRMCHLVLDRFDVLSKLFSPELRKISRFVTSNESKPLQVVVNCERWTHQTDLLVGILSTPLLVFTSLVECAVRSRIAHGITITKAKVDRLKRFVESNSTSRIAIGCNCAEDVYEARDAVMTICPASVILAHEHMPNVLLNEISCDWGLKKHPVLIFSDRVVYDFCVTDADVLIHFSLPASKSSFSERYVTIKDAIVQKSLNPEDKSTTKVHLIVNLEDPSVESPLPYIVELMSRFNVQIPSSIDDFVKNVKRTAENAKTTPFCDNLLQTGHCHTEDRCKRRHLLKEADQDNLDCTQGLVRVHITHTHSAVKFSVRILEFKRDPYGKGPWIRYKSDFQVIAETMAAFFGNRNNRRLHGWIRTGDLVACPKDCDTLFHRARVIDVVERNHNNEPKSVQIYALDFGYEMKVSANSLLELPEELKNFPDQSMYLYVANLKPVDCDIAWSAAACNIVETAIASMDDEMEEQDEILGRVWFRFGNNIVVDDLRWMKHPKSNPRAFLGYSLDLRVKILNSRCGLANNEYYTKMVEIFREANLEYFDVKKVLPKVMYNKEPPSWAHLTGENAYSPVVIFDVESPARFYVKTLQWEDALIDLQLDIADALKVRSTPFLNPEVGDVCVKRSSGSDTIQWKRCLIKDLQNEIATVLMVDYGGFEHTSIEELFELPWTFVTKLPFQAIECCLAGLKPSLISNDDWCEEAIVEFKNLIKDFESPFVKVVTSEESAQRTGGKRYNVVVVNLDHDGCVLNEKFSYGIRTIVDFDVNLNELMLYKDPDDQFQHADEAMVNADEPDQSSHSETEDVSMFDEFDCFISDHDEVLAQFGLSALKKKQMIEESPASDEQSLAVSQPKDDLNSAQSLHENGMTMVAPAEQTSASDLSMTATAEERGDFLPPLPKFGSKTPSVVWLQHEDTLTLRFMIPCLTRYRLDVTDTYINFIGSVSDDGVDCLYQRMVEFFGSVKGMFEEVEGISYLSVKFAKLHPGNWPWLTFNKTTDRGIVYHAGDFEEDNDDVIIQHLKRGRQTQQMKRLNRLYGDDEHDVSQNYLACEPEPLDNMDSDSDDDLRVGVNVDDHECI